MIKKKEGGCLTCDYTHIHSEKVFNRLLTENKHDSDTEDWHNVTCNESLASAENAKESEDKESYSVQCVRMISQIQYTLYNALFINFDYIMFGIIGKLLSSWT